jgi:hypothetical protein
MTDHRIHKLSDPSGSGIVTNESAKYIVIRAEFPIIPEKPRSAARGAKKSLSIVATIAKTDVEICRTGSIRLPLHMTSLTTIVLCASFEDFFSRGNFE